jgi:uncharacterized membrane protein
MGTGMPEQPTTSTWMQALWTDPAGRASAIVGGAAIWYLVVAWIADHLPTEPTTAAWAVPILFVLFGLVGGRPVVTAGLVWIGVELAFTLLALASGVSGDAGWGAYVWFALSSGFVAAFGAWVGAWSRGVGRRPLPGELPPRA